MNTAIILAAGQGTRMKSQTAKVLHKVGNKCLLQHVVDASSDHVETINVIVGHNSQAVKAAMPKSKINWVLQEKQLGTGHAAQQAIPFINDDSICLILYGDVPLLQSKTLEELLIKARPSGFSLLSVVLNDPFGYGRIIRDSNGLIQSIVEQKDASESELKVKEINTGIMAIQGSLLKRYLNELKPNNVQGELYLTDIVASAVKDNVNIASFVCENASEVMGINDKKQLSQAERSYQMRQAEDLMSAGLTIMDPSRFDCRGDLNFGEDCTIGVITCNYDGSNKHQTEVKDGAFIGSNSQLVAPVIIGKNATIGAGSTITQNAPDDKLTLSRNKQSTIDKWKRPTKK